MKDSNESFEKEYLRKGCRLIDAVENYIGFDPRTGLVRDMVCCETANLDTFENVSLAIAYLLNKKEYKAKRIISTVENLIGFDSRTKLVRNKLGSENIFLSDNAILVLGNLLLANYQEGERLMAGIEAFIGIDTETGLVRNGVNRPEIYSFNSLLLAADYFLLGDTKRSGAIFNAVLACMGFDPLTQLLWGIGNKKRGCKAKGLFTFDNAVLAVYYTLADQHKEAERTVSAIENYIGFDSHTGLAKKSTTEKGSELFSYVNNTLAMAYYSLSGRLIGMLLRK